MAHKLIYVLVILGVVSCSTVMVEKSKLKSGFTHEEVRKIHPVLIVDSVTLANPELTQHQLEKMLQNLMGKQVIVNTYLGPMYNTQLTHLPLNVIIQSGGGMVSLGLEVENILKMVRSQGFKIHCYVAEAQSMAFYLMVTSCDKVYAKVGTRLMQHRSAYGSRNFTPNTYQIDLDMAEAESEALGVDFNEWMKLTRGEKDHVFTLEEIKKYQLVDGWIK